MRQTPRTRLRARALGRLLTVLLPLLAAAPARLHAREEPVRPMDPEFRQQIIALKKIEVEQMHEGAQRRFEAAKRYAEAVRALRARGRHAPRQAQACAAACHGTAPLARGAARRGARLRQATGEEAESAVPQDARVPRPGASGFTAQGTTATPTNVRVNNPSGDGAGVGQAEESIAALGNNMLVAFNDGQGFVQGNPYLDTQGFAYSTDGGATFTDGGVPRRHPSYPAWTWTSDPIVTVNEKTGKFYYVALANPDATHNAVGLVSGSFSGTSFVWDSVRIARMELNTDYILDKPWVVADSASGNVYVTMTTFDATTPADWIDFTRTTNGGRTWSAPLTISDWATNGLVQASRPVVGPGGSLYAVWQAIGDTIANDYFKFAASPDRGVTFQPEVTPVAYYANFGTGAPGYNREFGVHFPSVAVDRTTGVNRGRIYLTWNESYNHLDDVFIPTGPRSEVEPNNAFASANLFTPGEVLRGQLSSSNPPDYDYWKFALSYQQSVIIWVDSLVTNETYTVRLFAPGADSAQRLCYSGDLKSDPGQAARQTYFTFTAPAAGTYYLRIGPAFTTSPTGNYRIKTKIGQRGSERGRDQRDAFVCWSGDGVNWSTPTRVNDDLPGFDDFLPEVAVGRDGCPYVLWRDHRSDLYGSRTHEYVSRSADGGGTWAANKLVTSSRGDFTASASNLIPNEGDYNFLFADSRYVRAAWSDGRSSSVDVWSATIDTDFQLTYCAHDTVTTAGSQPWMTWRVTNYNPLFSNTYTYTFTSQRNWRMPTDSVVVKAAATEAFIPLTVVPDTAKAGINRICLNLRNARNTLTRQCCANITVIPGGVAVLDDLPAALALGPPVPNPASDIATIQFQLPRSGLVRLVVYGLQGERVRTLAEGWRPAGRYSARWDGRDDRGRPVAAGAYFVRLESQGEAATRRMVWMR